VEGWWGANPPYHVPVFVLTHHPRPPLEMEGGTVFHFVTEGIEAALDQARTAAKGKDVRIGGGAATIRQYLQAGLLDEMHLAMSPILLGQGEPLFEGIELTALGYICCATIPPSENPRTSQLLTQSASKKSNACIAIGATVVGTLPDDWRTPALSNRMTSRVSPGERRCARQRCPRVEHSCQRNQTRATNRQEDVQARMRVRWPRKRDSGC
jgi:dihydrofolate reductase